MQHRTEYTPNQNSILFKETEGICPLCKIPIMFEKPKGKRANKSYDIAHIYPLNPKKEQIDALDAAKVQPPSDINSLENVICLCPTCHRKYDSDFKIEEYFFIKKIKQDFLQQTAANKLISEVKIISEVKDILDSICGFEFENSSNIQINFNTISIDNKLKHGINPIQRGEIKTNAINYYIRIKEQLKQLEEIDQSKVLELQAQIRLYYLKVSQIAPNNKDAIFNYIVEWLQKHTRKSNAACRVLISFFVQNCEIFDVNPQQVHST